MVFCKIGFFWVLKLISSSLMFLSVALTFVALFLLFKSKPLGFLRYLAVFLVFVALVGFGVYFAADSFTGKGVDESVLYHLKTDLSGAAFADFLPLIVLSAFFLIFSLILCFLLLDYLNAKKSKLWQLPFKLKLFEITNSRNGVLGTFFLILAVLFHPLSHNLNSLRKLYSQDPDIEVKSNLYSVAKSVNFSSNKKNVVLIYMEGIERSFLDQSVFPGLAPNLIDLEQNNISFTNIDQVYSTGFTMGGLVGTQCGIPIYTPSSERNSMQDYDSFLENIVCLGDVFDSNGYDTRFIGGANLKFAGKGKFLTTHGFDKVVGQTELIRANRVVRENFSRWGVPDDVMLREALIEMDDMASGDQPFLLSLLTVDTHPPKGHVSVQCEEVEYKKLNNPILDAVKCADIQIDEFITEIGKRPYAEDTIIVVMSDHLMMRSPVLFELEKTTRRNFFVIINFSNPEPKLIDRYGSVLDIAPTILSYLTGESHAFGFGRDLLNEKTKSLMENHGAETNKILIQNEKILQKQIWDFPDLNESIEIINNGATLRLSDERSVNLPVILIMDEQSKVSGIDFQTPYAKRNKDYLLNKRPEDKAYLWVDKCTEMKPIDTSPEKIINFEGFCAAYSKADDERVKIQPMNLDEPLLWKTLQ